MENKIFLSFIFLVLLSTGVVAAGAGEGSSADTQTNSETNVDDGASQRETNVDDGASQRINCETRETLRERVKCRIENKGRLEITEEANVPEACRRLEQTEAVGRLGKERCKALYANVRGCYALPRVSSEGGRDACFRRVAGLGTAVVSGNADKTALRQYVVTLLYEIEERIEAKQETGDITSEQAAEVIGMIVEIKEKIMNGDSRDEIRPMIQELKIKIKGLDNE
ncbi:hypothetical protein HY450_00535 [Candidatus Pacearchaeota archaeon]|nr:hypothetical protein [Candidatus Pacearchaeota archaeon]